MKRNKMKYLFFLLSAFSFAQQTKFVNFKSVLGKIEINPIDKSVSGEVTYDFEVTSTIDTIRIDAQNMTFTNLKINNSIVNYKNLGKKIALFEGYKIGKNTLTFNYLAKPKQAMYFVGVDENLQIWTQGQGKYTSNWFPSFDDVNEKVIFNLDVNFDKNLIKLGVALKDKNGFQNISNYLIDGVNKDLALQQIEAIEENLNLKNALRNAIEAKSMIISTHSILDSENQNLKLVSSMIAVDFACNNEKGAVKTLIPDINIGKVNIHCASGKDRTGISLTDATNKAVSEKLGLNEQQAKDNLKTQIKGGHTQELASLNGGTPGCHGVKSDSKTALSKGNILSELIENTEVTPMSQTKNDSKRETFFINYRS
jgi:hypothetical protein